MSGRRMEQADSTARRCHSLIAGVLKLLGHGLRAVSVEKATRAATSELSGDHAQKRAFRPLTFIVILRMARGLGR